MQKYNSPFTDKCHYLHTCLHFLQNELYSLRRGACTPNRTLNFDPTAMDDHSLHIKYLAVNRNDLAWGLAVNSVGFQDIAPGEPYPPSEHPSRYLFSEQRGRILSEYQLLYITRGKGRFRSASLGGPIPLGRGSLFLLFPGEWHSYAPQEDTGWKEYWIGFEGAQMESWVKAGFFSPHRPIFEAGLQDDIVGLYQEAIEVASSQEAAFQQRLGGIVSHLLGLTFFHERNENFSEVSDNINRAKILIAEHYRDITPQEVARKLCMGYSNFRRIFKEYTGFSPAKYIQNLRLGKVREALTNTTVPIKEVAYEFGYENYDYFFSMFKKETGMTPAHYRRITRGEGSPLPGDNAEMRPQ